MEDFIQNASYVSITNEDLIEITWLIDRVSLRPKVRDGREDVREELLNILERHGALQFYSNQVHDVRALLDYKILSAMHGFFKGTAYESKAFIQICIDDSKKNKLKYALLSIQDYNSSEHDKIILQKFETYYQSLKSGVSEKG
jgi:hypothetical protein